MTQSGSSHRKWFAKTPEDEGGAPTQGACKAAQSAHDHRKVWTGVL
jgi:hypothetical protein